jgi:hypothetical protein
MSIAAKNSTCKPLRKCFFVRVGAQMPFFSGFARRVARMRRTRTSPERAPDVRAALYLKGFHALEVRFRGQRRKRRHAVHSDFGWPSPQMRNPR